MYTRRGDRGETGLYGPKRVGKDSLRVEAYGTIDELNSFIGLALAVNSHPEVSGDLEWVQGKLFVAGGDLATDDPSSGKVPRISEADTKRVESMVDALQPKLSRLTSFILPGGSVLSGHLHVARTVCRRAERAVVRLMKAEEGGVNQELLPFLNRLSTYLFNLARYANSLEGRKDELWKRADDGDR